MKKRILAILAVLGILKLGNAIEEGQPAYDFKLLNDKGKEVRLSEYKGRWIVLYFYPKADTPGCTTQGKEYTKLYDEFENLGVKVFGISTDSVDSIKKFKDKYGLKVEYISDPKGEVAKAYGVKLFFGLCSRDTVIINKDFKVEKIYRGVNPSADPVNVLNYIKNKS